MSVATIRALLQRQQASIRLIDDKLALRGPSSALKNRELTDLIRAHRGDILALMEAGESFEYGDVAESTPPNRLLPDTDKITPDLLPLLELSQGEIDHIVATIPGGARAIQDIYPLTPLQEGMLFHYLMAAKGDPYLLWSMIAFADRETLDAYIEATNAVVSRHDILRTALRWESLREPVQVVLRHARLPIEEIDLDPAHGDVVDQLKSRFDPTHYRMDLRNAPLIRLVIARDTPHDRWVAMLLSHHLTTDRTTGDIIDSEVRAIMQARIADLAAPVPYRNLVARIRSSLSRSEHESFFKELLGGVEKTTAPFGLLDVHRDGSQITELSIALSEDISQRLLAQARSNGLGAASILHVAWGYVLARTCGVHTPVFGTVLFGRMQAGGASERILGPSINTLPVLIDVNTPVLECVRRTQNLLATLLRHEYAPLTLTQKAAGLPNGIPLFTSVLNYRHSSSRDRPLLDPRTEADAKITFIVGHEGNNYPLTLSVDDFGSSFSLSIQAARGIDPELVLSLTRTSVTNIVEALERTPLRPLCDLDVLASEQKFALLGQWRGETIAWTDDICIHHLFERQANTTPDNVAIRASGQTVTYRELNERSNQLAHLLQRSGIVPSSIVGLCLRRSVDHIVALLAVFKAGGACLPLDPDYPRERLNYLVQDSRCELVVMTAAHADLITESHIRRVLLDQLDQTELPLTRPAVEVTPDDIAYLLYTSGSTGAPKGAIGLHRALTSRLLPERSRCRGSEVYALKTSINFIDSFWEVFLPLVTGAIIEVMPAESLQDPAEFCRVLDERGISHIVLVPTLLSALVMHLENTNRSLINLQYCVSSGEPLSTELANRFKARIPHAALVNIYGTTEFWDATAHIVAFPETSASVPLGFPLPNVGIYVLDERMSPVPPGVDGELYVTSPGIGPGYVRRDDLTAKAFLPCPFEPGRTMYRTGDRVRWHAGLGLEYLGRVDQQINLRGFRIEPKEIEHALTQLRGIKDAVVVARTDGGQTRLAGYVVPSALEGDRETMGFGMFYFSDSGTSTTTDDMSLYIETVKRADQLGFDAVWTPERHFTQVGAAFPNPSVLSAAAAMVTERVQLRSGSVVLPLHNPVRVAEEWAVVDRLSGGRVALSFASGWVPNDFVLAPENFEHRHEVMLASIQTVQTLWRGGTVAMRNGVGAMVDVAIQPRPVQSELPVWITAAGAPKTFLDAARLGANVLTHVLNTTISGLADKIAMYRSARKKAGFDPSTGKVALMLHAYVREDASAAVAEARPYLEHYFRSQLKLRKDVGEALGLEVHTDQALSDEVITLAVNRYLATKALIGSPESCSALVQELQDAGVDEIACLIDFGLPSERIMAGIESLDRLRRASTRRLRPSALREQLAAALPSYMVPDSITVLDKLPLTPSGKVDRRVLPEPSAARRAGTTYIAPRNALEAGLAAIWAEVLRIEKVGITDGFFDLGGNSMAAIRMINRAQKVLGLKISVRDLFDRQTIAALSTVSAAEAPAPQRSWMLRLSPGAGKTPLFCMHGGTGNASFYAKLANYVGRDTPLYAFHYPALLPNGPTYAAIADLARDYIARIRDVQPEGPYQLLGWSFGGLTAFEMARHLQADGQTVSFLGMLDAPAATEIPSAERWSDLKALRYLLMMNGWQQDADDLSAVDLERGLDILKARQIVPDNSSTDDLLRSLLVVQDIVQMRIHYKPGNYIGDISYISGTHDDRYIADAISRWQAVVNGDIALTKVDAPPYRMFDDAHIAEVGAAVRNALSHAHERTLRAGR